MENKKEKIKAFVCEHKKEILIGVAIIATGGVTLKMGVIHQVAMNSLNREERRILFEKKEILESIERLDHNAPINRFHKIPRRLKRIEELDVDLLTIKEDKKKIKFKLW